LKEKYYAQHEPHNLWPSPHHPQQTNFCTIQPQLLKNEKTKFMPTLNTTFFALRKKKIETQIIILSYKILRKENTYIQHKYILNEKYITTIKL